MAAPVQCRKCRHLLCTSSHFVEHETGEAAKKFHYKNGSSRAPQDVCTSFFVQLQPWMNVMEEDKEEDDATVEGKLFCPNPSCNARIGSYYWQGVQCSCGTWVAPAFQLSKSKVDVVKSREELAATRPYIAQPRRSAAALNPNRPPVIPQRVRADVKE